MDDIGTKGPSDILTSEQIKNALLEIEGRPRDDDRTRFLALSADEKRANEAVRKIENHCRKVLALMFDAQQTRGSPDLLVGVMLSRAVEIDEILDLYIKSTTFTSS